MIDKKLFIESCNSIKEHFDFEDKLNEMIQRIAIEFLYTGRMDVVNNLVSVIEASFPNQVKQYHGANEDWNSPVSCFLFEKLSKAGSNIRFYNKTKCINISINTYEELYDTLIKFEKEG